MAKVIQPYGKSARNGRLADGTRLADTLTIPGLMDFCSNCKGTIKNKPIMINGKRYCKRCVIAIQE
jgi:hypothetical protein